MEVNSGEQRIVILSVVVYLQILYDHFSGQIVDYMMITISVYI
jgi:hypothetical protein